MIKKGSAVWKGSLKEGAGTISSETGVLKNALDHASRPYGQSVWSGKPAAVASVSPGAIGGFGANHHLRQSLVFLDMPVLQQPEFYLGGADKLFDDSGALRADSKAGELFDKFINAFAAWVAQHAHQRAG